MTQEEKEGLIMLVKKLKEMDVTMQQIAKCIGSDDSTVKENA